MANKKRILITGVSGQLGSNLAYCLRDGYEVCGLYYTHEICMDGVPVYRCDLRVKAEAEKALRDLSPDIVIHCAALADVETCEEFPDQAEQINVAATKNIVDAIDNSVKLIYISSDLVYDGVKGNFSEDDPAGPLNVYARSKLNGEKEALKAAGAVVLRTNFFGWNVYERESLGEWVIHSLSSDKTIKGFTDAKFSSIYTFDLAKLMDKVIQRGLSGIYNLGSGSSLSKYDFAVAVADKLDLNAEGITPISIDNFDFKARRSKDVSLDVSKSERDLGLTSVSIEESIEHFTEDFNDGISGRFKSFAIPKVANER